MQPQDFIILLFPGDSMMKMYPLSLMDMPRKVWNFYVIIHSKRLVFSLINLSWVMVE